MGPKERVVLEITTALISADPEILKSGDAQFIDRRINAALELLSKVSQAVEHKFPEGFFDKG